MDFLSHLDVRLPVTEVTTNFLSLPKTNPKQRARHIRMEENEKKEEKKKINMFRTENEMKIVAVRMPTMQSCLSSSYPRYREAKTHSEGAGLPVYFPSLYLLN